MEPSIAVAAATSNPARTLRLGGSAGRVEVGGRADLVVVDQTWEVVATVIGGVVAYERRPLADGEAEPAPTPGAAATVPLPPVRQGHLR
jgi:adenine deaminase